MEKTIDECLSKLKELADQANADDHIKISSFIQNLLSAENVEPEVYHLILGYFDNLQDDDMSMYRFLLENGADASWYEFVEFMCDQRGPITDYFSILSDCFFNHISIEEMHDIERNSKDLDEFRILAKEKISSVRSDGTMKKIAVEQEFIEHLKAENALLNERLDSVMREINQCRMEQQNMLEMSMSNKKASMDYKLEAERLKKESLRNKSELTMAEKKSVNAQEMIRQLNALNDRLISEKAEREEMAGKLQSELDSVKEDYLCKEAENEVLKRQIKLLEQQKADVRMSNLGKHNDASEGEADSYEEDPAFLAQPADRGSLENGYYEETAIDEEIDELDYSPEDLIPIENRKKEVVRHSNFFSQIVSRYFENKFCKKSQAEQDNLIFIKLMENEFSKDMVYLVKKALNENNSMSRLELYKLIINRADDGDIIRFCSAE